MVSFTSKARLAKPAAQGEVVDVALFNSNMDKIDELLGVRLVTSTTRPSNPFPGMIIRETDTGITYIRNLANDAWSYHSGIALISRYRSAATQSVPDSTLVPISLSTTNVDTTNGNMYEYHGTERVYEIKEPGYYYMEAFFAFDDSSTQGYRRMYISSCSQVDGLIENASRRVTAASEWRANSGSSYSLGSLSVVVRATEVYKYFGLEVFQTSGTTLATYQSLYSSANAELAGPPRMTIQRIG